MTHKEDALILRKPRNNQKMNNKKAALIYFPKIVKHRKQNKQSL